MKLHLTIGSDYGDILYWKASLPKNNFAHYVREILFAEKNGTKANIPVPKAKGEQDGLTDIRIEIKDKDVIRYLKSIPSQKKNETVKTIIRKHIDAAYAEARVKPPKMVSLDSVKAILLDISCHLAYCEIQLSKMPNKDSILLDDYQKAFQVLNGVIDRL